MGKKIAVIHDWLNGMRGGEMVLEELLDLLPGAVIFTLFLDKNRVSKKILDHKIYTSSLNRYGFIKKRYRNFLPMFPSLIEEFDLNGYDLIVSSSHCVAKGVIPHPGSKHISYIHSPMRYAWDQYHSYFGNISGLKKNYIRNRISKLRTWDVASSSRVDLFIANSTFVRDRIKRYYNRDSVVIHPPVDTGFFTPSKNSSGDFFLSVTALVPYKRTDIVINAFNKLNEKLVIVGSGPDEKRLKKMAGKNIEFKKNISRDKLLSLYQNASAFVFAGIEDFGMAFAESMSCGTPVISFQKGGVKDIVTPSTGILYGDQSTDSLFDSVKSLRKKRFAGPELRKRALSFSREKFKERILKYLDL